MPASLAVHVDRLPRGAVDEREKVRDGLRWRLRVRRQRNPEELHPRPGDQTGFVRVAVLSQIDDGFHTERREIAVVASFRLRASVIPVVDPAEVVDRDVRIRGARAPEQQGGDGRSKVDTGNSPSGTHNGTFLVIGIGCLLNSATANRKWSTNRDRTISG